MKQSKRESLEILKSIGKSNFPRRREDFLFPDQMRFPMYPFQRWVDTAKHFAKSENLSKCDNPFSVMKSIIDYRERNYQSEFTMFKSQTATVEAKEIGIYFNIKGSKIKEAIKSKIAELQQQKQNRIKLLTESMALNNLVTVGIDENSYDAKSDFEIKNIESQIKRLQSIHDHIDVSKTFKLCDWDLERYGL